MGHKKFQVIEKSTSDMKPVQQSQVSARLTHKACCTSVQFRMFYRTVCAVEVPQAGRMSKEDDSSEKGPK